MYKTIFGIFAVTFSIAAPGLSFAQSTQPLTRAEVRADLVRVEQAGYSPGRGLKEHSTPGYGGRGAGGPLGGGSARR
jgi:hypothetical protein